MIVLQEYVRLLEPTDLQSLCYDRRDLNKFFSFLMAAVFEVTTLVLFIMAVILAAGEIASAFRTGG